ncbi:hypothetical protein CEP51_015220 [Fusarium floridanum]|uniref:Uncharacterized protein n=1 Tax=Fusarium floridanum TaxID=1325733 RepID=A0A428PED9_9HYPO|nr:hypothetical protein CEP51_015220 [Fusarium floridanum]
MTHYTAALQAAIGNQESFVARFTGDLRSSYSYAKQSRRATGGMWGVRRPVVASAPKRERAGTIWNGQLNLMMANGIFHGIDRWMDVPLGEEAPTGHDDGG